MAVKDLPLLQLLYSHGDLSHIPVNTFELCTYLTVMDSHDFFIVRKLLQIVNIIFSFHCGIF